MSAFQVQLEKAQQGETDAAAEIFADYRGMIRALSLSFQIDRFSDISHADLIQEAWAQIIKQLPRFRIVVDDCDDSDRQALEQKPETDRDDLDRDDLESESVSIFESGLRKRFQSWLYTVAQREMLRVLERRQAKKNDPSKRILPLQPEENGKHNENSHTPQNSFFRRESIDELKAAIGKLPIENQEIINRCFFDGTDFRRISDAMGLSYDQVRHRVAKSLVELKRLLGAS